MKLKNKKKKKNGFVPRKNEVMTPEMKQMAQKHPHGHRFGLRWFPYNKDGGI